MRASAALQMTPSMFHRTPTLKNLAVSSVALASPVNVRVLDSGGSRINGPSRGFSIGELCTDLDILSSHRFLETLLSQ